MRRAGRHGVVALALLASVGAVAVEDGAAAQNSARSGAAAVPYPSPRPDRGDAATGSSADSGAPAGPSILAAPPTADTIRSRFETTNSLLRGSFGRADENANVWLPGPWTVPPTLDGAAPAGDRRDRIAALLDGMPGPGLEAAGDGSQTPPDEPAADGAASSRPSLLGRAYGAMQRGFALIAYELALEAAGADEPAAYTLTGILLEEGVGPPRDLEKAAGWYALAVEAGDAGAMNRLGGMLLGGFGVKRDIARAADLFERAAALGEPQAAYNLALLVLAGEERPRDGGKAAELLEIAAEAEIAEAQYALARLVMEGDGVIPDDRRASRLLRRASRNGHVPAMVDFAIRRFNGVGIEADEAEAAMFLRRAALSGNPVAMNRYAHLLALGRGVEMNEIEAARWHLMARDRGISDLWLDGFVGSRPPFVVKEARRRADRG